VLQRAYPICGEEAEVALRGGIVAWLPCNARGWVTSILVPVLTIEGKIAVGLPEHGSDARAQAGRQA